MSAWVTATNSARAAGFLVDADAKELISARLLVSISLGGGLGLAVAADIRARREAPPRL